jgi:hypothetical protein
MGASAEAAGGETVHKRFRGKLRRHADQQHEVLGCDLSAAEADIYPKARRWEDLHSWV